MIRIEKINPLVFFILVTVLLTSLVISPILTLFLMSLKSSGGIWQHLIDTVHLRYISNTVLLMVWVGAIALVIAIVPAWLVSNYCFHLSRILDWILILPAACPAYLVA